MHDIEQYYVSIKLLYGLIATLIFLTYSYSKPQLKQVVYTMYVYTYMNHEAWSTLTIEQNHSYVATYL